jgi:hypothetical protein
MCYIYHGGLESDVKKACCLALFLGGKTERKDHTHPLLRHARRRRPKTVDARCLVPTILCVAMVEKEASRVCERREGGTLTLTLTLTYPCP